jgi:hypothetical protein
MDSFRRTWQSYEMNLTAVTYPAPPKFSEKVLHFVSLEVKRHPGAI